MCVTLGEARMFDVEKAHGHVWDFEWVHTTICRTSYSAHVRAIYRNLNVNTHTHT